MGWVALGMLAFAGGVLLLRAGMPDMRAHAAIVRNALLGEVHVYAFLLLVVFGFALAIKGLFGLAASPTFERPWRTRGTRGGGRCSARAETWECRRGHRLRTPTFPMGKGGERAAIPADPRTVEVRRTHLVRRLGVSTPPEAVPMTVAPET